MGWQHINLVISIACLGCFTATDLRKKQFVSSPAQYKSPTEATMKISEQALTDKAKKYLKDVYGEDTVSMTVLENDVENGDGDMSVECTVLIAGEESDWFKEFTFKNGQVTNMTWQMK